MTSHRSEAVRPQSPTPPSEILQAHAALLPTSGVGLDVAGGTGKNTLWLAARGVSMTILDLAESVLDEAVRTAEARGLTIAAEVRDVEANGLPDQPGEAGWDVIVKTYFVWRDVVAVLPACLNPGGIALFAQPTETNLERHPRPSRRYLLGSGEMESIAASMRSTYPQVEVIDCSEGWRPNGAHEAWLVIRSLLGDAPHGAPQ